MRRALDPRHANVKKFTFIRNFFKLDNELVIIFIQWPNSLNEKPIGLDVTLVQWRRYETSEAMAVHFDVRPPVAPHPSLGCKNVLLCTSQATQ
jgi:hypothetical protein